LDALMSYTRTHFVLEERLMQQAKYKDLEAHKKEHRELIELLDRLHERSLSRDEAVYHEMMDFLKTWLKEHIRGVDTKYSTALKQAGFSVAAWEREASAEFKLKSREDQPWWKFWKPT
jgi:hemerythrin